MTEYNDLNARQNCSMSIKMTEINEIMESCRVCMARSSKMNQIFDTECNSISDKIQFCTGVRFTKLDGLPTQICEACLGDLSVAHKFKTLCLLADETYRNLLLQCKVKDEVLDMHTDNEETHCDDGFSEELGDATKDSIRDEFLKEDVRKNGRKSSRISLKKEKSESIKEAGVKPTIKKRMKRGPYNKTGKPKRLRKLKYRRLWCEPCGIKFTSKLQSDEHKRDLHKNDDWVCEICGKTFAHRGSHYTHVRSHLPPRYGCEHCDYKTWHKHDLVKHVRIHTGVKQYHCELCSASFYTSSNMKCHIRRYHERLKRHACHLCERSFYDRTKLNRHIDSHNDVKRFECEVCHSCFTRRCYWKKHLQRQHGVVVPPQRPGRQKANLLVGERASGRP